MSIFRKLPVFAAASAAALLAALPAQSREITAAVVSGFTTLDPWDANDNLSRSVSRSIYEGLYTFDSNLRPVPQLAENYEVSKDGLTYTFQLRRGVKFHDGTEFTADAVKLNFDRGLNPSLKLMRRSFFSFVDRVDVVSRYVVRFTLKTPTVGFIQRLSNGTAAMICPGLLKGADTKQALAYEACGTGPYLLKRFSPTEELYVVKNPHYRTAGIPKLDAIRWIPVPENATRSAMLQTGEAQFISPVPNEEFRMLEGKEDLVLEKIPSVVTRYISMNETKKPFGDIRVRQAVNYAINRRALVKVAYNGLAVPSTGYLPMQIEGAVNFGEFPYDPERARKLLKEAGYPHGFETTLWSAYNDGKSQKMLQFLQQQLAQVGIRVTTRALEAGQRSLVFGARTPEASEHRLFLRGWSNSTADPDWGLRPLLYSRNMPPVLLDDSYYRNPQVDQLFDKAIAETDPDKRDALYAELQKLVHADMPWAPLVFEMTTAAVRKELKNFHVMPDGSFDFYEAQWAD